MWRRLKCPTADCWVDASPSQRTKRFLAVTSPLRVSWIVRFFFFFFRIDLYQPSSRMCLLSAALMSHLSASRRSYSALAHGGKEDLWAEGYKIYIEAIFRRNKTPFWLSSHAQIILTHPRHSLCFNQSLCWYLSNYSFIFGQICMFVCFNFRPNSSTKVNFSKLKNQMFNTFHIP